MFSGFAPINCPAFAGNYRGYEHCTSLKGYRVQIPADPRVGVEPYLVSYLIERANDRCKQIFAQHAIWRKTAKGNKVSPEIALIKFVEHLCEFLEQFLLIHPYANGNGHVARFAVAALCSRYGYAAHGWPIHESPPYGTLISQYRDGDRKPLIAFVLGALKKP